MFTEVLTGIAVTTMAITGAIEAVDAIIGNNSKKRDYPVIERYDSNDETHEARLRRIREMKRLRAAERDIYSPAQLDYSPQSLVPQPIQIPPFVAQQDMPAPVYPQPYIYPIQQPVQYAPAPLLQQGSAVLQQPAYNYPGVASTVTMTTNDLYELFVKAVNYGYSLGQNSVPQQPSTNFGL